MHAPMNIKDSKIMECLCGRQMFHVPCGTRHLSGFVIRNIRQDIFKLMESREMLVQVLLAGVGDERDPCEVTVRKNWGYINC